MPAPTRTFATRDGDLTAAEIYAECRRMGGFNAGALLDREQWQSLTSAMRRIAHAEGLSVSTHTERERSWPHRPNQRVQVHKNGLLAYPDAPTRA